MHTPAKQRRTVREAIQDRDNPLWPILIGTVVISASGLMLAFRYNHFDPPRDLETMVAVGSAYFAAYIGKRIFTRTGGGTSEKKD